MRYFKNIIIHY